MKIGVPKEIKTLEFRVGMTPAGVRELVTDGHEVIVETNAGEGIGRFCTLCDLLSKILLWHSTAMTAAFSMPCKRMAALATSSWPQP